MAAAQREQGETMASVVVQGGAAEGQRGDHGQVGRGQFGGEGVFLGDGLVGPAAGPVELGHQRRAALDADAVDAVLVAVERQHAAVGEQAERLDRVEDAVRVEPGERRLVHRPGSSSAVAWAAIGAAR